MPALILLLSVHFPFPLFSSPLYFIIDSDLFAVIFCIYLCGMGQYKKYAWLHCVSKFCFETLILMKRRLIFPDDKDLSYTMSEEYYFSGGIFPISQYGNSNNHCGMPEGSPEFVKDFIVIIKMK